MRTKRLTIGDVFTLPVDEDRVAYGQVVAAYGDDARYFAVFERLYRRAERPATSVVVQDRIALLALSLDAKFRSGEWSVVGHEPVSDDVPLPAYQEIVGSPDRVDIVDYSGTRRRQCTPEESRQLGRRTVVAPVRLQKALRAKHGLEPWETSYSKLQPDEATSASRFFGPR